MKKSKIMIAILVIALGLTGCAGSNGYSKELMNSVSKYASVVDKQDDRDVKVDIERAVILGSIDEEEQAIAEETVEEMYGLGYGTSKAELYDMIEIMNNSLGGTSVLPKDDVLGLLQLNYLYGCDMGELTELVYRMLWYDFDVNQAIGFVDEMYKNGLDYNNDLSDMYTTLLHDILKVMFNSGFTADETMNIMVASKEAGLHSLNYVPNIINSFPSYYTMGDEYNKNKEAELLKLGLTDEVVSE